jgi:cyclase
MSNGAPALEIVEAAPGVYAAIGPMGGSNSGFIVGERAVLVVDTRINPFTAQQLKEAIEEVTDRPVRYVVNTHFHGDHTFGNQVFADGATVIGSALTQERLENEGQAHLEWLGGFFPVDFSGVQLTPPDATISGETTIDLGGRRVHLLETAQGHTGGDVMVWDPESRVLFTGDVLVLNQMPWLGHSPSTARLIDDLLELTNGDARTFVPGHGMGFTTAERKDVFKFVELLADLRQQVAALVDGGAELDEVQAKVDLSRYASYRMTDNERWVAGNVERVYREIALGETTQRHRLRCAH